MKKSQFSSSKYRWRGLLRINFASVLMIAAVFQVNAEAYSSSEISGKTDYPGLIVEIQDSKEISVSGVITDDDGIPVPGATVVIIGTTKGIITDFDGKYNISCPSDATLQFSFIGLVTQKIVVANRKTIDVVLQSEMNALEDVTVVAFGKQKKESVMASIETIKPAELKIGSSNLTTALAGRMSGLVSYQRSGEPGADNANFFVRGVTSFSYASGPLILIDGVESSNQELAAMQPDDIESFSIMKDAAATAVYGARGGNGVIMVNTKRGTAGKLKVNVRHEQSWSMATQNVKLADPVTYMKENNAAALARNPFADRVYSLEKIENTEKGINSMAFPANDWYKMLFNDNVRNSRTNFSLNGGGQKAKYYIAATFNEDNGNLKVDKQNDFNNNIKVRDYIMRSNIDLELTNTTDAVVRFVGQFKDYSGPLRGGNEMYGMIMRADPVAFPAYYTPESTCRERTHILFGNDPEKNYYNPYAEMTKGYKEATTSVMKTQVEIKQDLKFITPGLTARFLYSTNRYSYFDANRAYNPYFYYVEPGSYDRHENTFELMGKNPTSGTEYLNYSPAERNVSSSNYYESVLNYATEINERHDITGMLVSTVKNYQAPGKNLTLSLPSRNIGYAGRFTYGLDSKYFAEVNFGLNGSERFARKNRWGFFPSAGLGYIISKESFWRGALKKVFTSFKLKATYGLSGTDAIGDAEDRFFYMANVNLNNGDRAYSWGDEGRVSSTGVSISRYPNENITWETSRKMNLGIETDIFNDFHLAVDYYTEHRTDILMERKSIPKTMGLLAIPTANVGEAKGHGIDGSLDFNHSWSNGAWLSLRGNFTYAVSNFEYYEDVDRTETPWLQRNGRSTTQTWGYIAERLFIDDNDVRNSADQTFGQYGAGDIKYKDINKDGKITALDQVAIGNPRRPEIVYGFGFSGGYKGFDFSAFFQGIANESFFINAEQIQPFVEYDVENARGTFYKNGLLQAIADDHWTLENQDPNAMWPRLSDRKADNNIQASNWWMRDGSFMRLKTLELGYSLPDVLTKKLGFNKVRFYTTGINLLTFSKFKLWDPEMAGQGFNYPIQKVYNVGVQIGL